MTHYEAMKAAAFASSSGGGVDNLFTSEIEIGTIDGNGANTDNANRLRTKDFITLEAGTYALIYTSDLQTVMFRYAPDGTFIDRSNYGRFSGIPLRFDALEGQKFRFIFSKESQPSEMSLDDLHNPMLLKD